MKVIESRFYDVTVINKMSTLYCLVQADSAEEAAQMCKQFGDVDGVRKTAVNSVILKENSHG